MIFRRAPGLAVRRIVALSAILIASGCSGSTSSGDDPPAATVVAEQPPSSVTPATTAGETSSTPPTTHTATDSVEHAPVAPFGQLRVGAEVLADTDFAILQGQRVGAIVNQTSLIDNRRLIDALAERSDIALVRLFAPEHGIDGSLAAGVALADSIDKATGVPVASLYGATRAPTIEMFADLDVVVFDLQDVGSRSYTYISTMGLAMETAAATRTRFVVLDRPNPAGGQRVNGLTLEQPQASFIGMYPLPNVHGLTVGEIAQLIVDEAWLPGLDELDLTVVPMTGWSRKQLWDDLGRDWVAPSPRLPTADIALLYTGIVLLGGTSISDGSGTATPFALVGAPFIESGDDLAAMLEARQLPGIRFEATTFTPLPIPGVSPHPLHEGVVLDGVRLVVSDRRSIDPVRVAIEVLVASQLLAPTGTSVITDPTAFDLVAGTPELRQWIEQGDSADAILERLQSTIADFEQLRTPALQYE